MNETQRIGVFYSRGPHFLQALKHLRTRYPRAWIAALTPPEFPREFVEGLCDEVIETGHAAYSMRDWRALLALRKQIRGGRFDVFVVLFPSLKQRLLAAFSGSRERYCFGIDGELRPLRWSIVSGLADALCRNVRGRLTYAYIHYVVHHRPVRRDGGER
jgi:hypothetical protein